MSKKSFTLLGSYNVQIGIFSSVTSDESMCHMLSTALQKGQNQKIHRRARGSNFEKNSIKLKLNSEIIINKNFFLQ